MLPSVARKKDAYPAAYKVRRRDGMVINRVRHVVTVTNTATINHTLLVIHAHRYPRRAINYCLLILCSSLSMHSSNIFSACAYVTY